VSITARVLVVVMVMGAAVTTVGGIAVWSIASLEAILARLDANARETLALARLEQRILRADRLAGAMRAAIVRERRIRLARNLDAALDDVAARAARVRRLNENDEDGSQRIESILEAVGSIVSSERQVAAQVMNGMSTGGAFASLALADEARRERFDALLSRFDAMGERLASRAAALGRASDAKADRLVMTMLAVGVAALLLATAISILTVRGTIVRPLVGLRDAVVRLSDGEMDVNVPDSSRRDEIGELLRSTRTLQLRLVEAERARRGLAEETERRKAAEDKLVRDLVVQLEADVASVVKSVASAAGRLGTSATSLQRSARGNDAQAGRATRSAEETSHNVQAVASAAEELATSAREIGDRVAQSAAISTEALKQAESTSGLVAGLANSAAKIGEVVDLIEDIANQTNLLALNATIEAARAGDAGKGFSVVATEVKSLAEQTANATKEISSQIGAVQEDVSRVVEAIETLRANFTKANELAASVASAIEEQSVATGAIAQSVQQAAVSTQDVATAIVDMSKVANDTDRGAAGIVEAADELTNQADTLRTRMSSFITAVTRRAA